MDFKTIKDVKIPQGNVIKIHEASSGRVLWQKKGSSQYSYPPNIIPNQVFDVYTDRSIGSVTIKADNVYSFPADLPAEYKPKASEITWSWSGLPDGMSMLQRSDTLYITDTTPTSTGTFRVRVSVTTPFGSDEEYITINATYTTVKPTPEKNQVFYVAAGQPVPRYQLFYTSPLSDDDMYKYDYEWILMGAPIDKSNLRYDSSKGVIYSGSYVWDSVQANAFQNTTPNWTQGWVYADTVQYNISYTPDPNKPYKRESVGGGFSVYVYNTKQVGSSYIDIKNIHYPNTKIVVSGIPEALAKVGGSAELEFLWATTSPYVANDGVWRINPKYMTFSVSSNLSVSGTTFTVKSAGTCSVRVTTPRTFTGDGSISSTITWSAKG